MFLPRDEVCKCSTQVCMACPSARKSSSSERFPEKSSTTSRAESIRPTLPSSSSAAPRFMICRSAATCLRIPGRWILTTTSSPECSVA
ncbi:Uncharacterised protein [Mycobacteroides abscessus subsp. abscessus]|nr:Uncharacterised protein [Mycobacteroides abscessus subsp. abscessus]